MLPEPVLRILDVSVKLFDRRFFWFVEENIMLVEELNSRKK